MWCSRVRCGVGGVVRRGGARYGGVRGMRCGAVG